MLLLSRKIEKTVENTQLKCSCCMDEYNDTNNTVYRRLTIVTDTALGTLHVSKFIPHKNPVFEVSTNVIVYLRNLSSQKVSNLPQIS